jgi:hypothetical protein
MRELDKYVAKRPSRGVAALSLECSVRFDSCCPYLLPFCFPCIRPAMMACGLPQRPISLLNTSTLPIINLLAILALHLYTFLLRPHYLPTRRASSP